MKTENVNGKTLLTDVLWEPLRNFVFVSRKGHLKVKVLETRC